MGFAVILEVASRSVESQNCAGNYNFWARDALLELISVRFHPSSKEFCSG